MNRLCLDYLTALEVGPAELVLLAADNGVPLVSASIGVVAGQTGRGDWPTILDPPTLRETRRRGEETGVGVDTIEAFHIRPETIVADCTRAIEAGAEVGAARAIILVHGEDHGLLRDQCHAFCDIAAANGLSTLVEHSPRSAFPTLAGTLDFAASLGRPDFQVEADPLHMFRAGIPMRELARHGADTIARAQLCDGPARVDPEKARYEAIAQRMIPGEGVIPLQDFVDAIPDNIVLGLEVPLASHQMRGVGAAERVRLVVAAARRFLDARRPQALARSQGGSK